MKRLFSAIVNNFALVMTIYVISLFSMAYLFSVYENHSYSDGFYWATCTSLTIGYGDFSPHTDMMKVLTILLAHFWAFIIIPAVIIKFFMTFIEDRDAFTHEEQEDIKDQLATLIHSVAAYHAIVQSQLNSADSFDGSDGSY